MPTERAMGLAIAKMCEAFANLGKEVVLILPKRKNILQNKDIFEYYKLNNNFKIKYITCLDLGFLIKTPFWFPILYISFIFNLKRFLKKEENFILYTREAEVLYFLDKKYKAVLEIHHFNGLRNFFAKNVLSKIYKIIALTEGVKKDLQSKFQINAEKILVKGSGLDIKQFEDNFTKADAREKLNLQDEKLPIAMYIGVLEKWKGFDTFLKASILLNDKVRFLVIGGKNSEILDLKKDYTDVVFLGSMPYLEINLNQKAADVLVVPNTAKDEVSAKYTSPLKVLAHMASGVPILVSDLPSTREILDESNATFFDADNPESLASKLIYILENLDLIKIKSEKAQKEIVKYDWNLRAHDIINFIKY